ncbi:hypothetical protein [Alienimonas chondri]|uniref:Uncharacterized protein n=1 Tax=Alienimonas chondri TaxID=2681879 RepID=A0ABX1VCD6_9PLAN|nr:hypothetical protein [Alienimonas chondri]NNJ24887.1 hypothetical protein [Alienimonas chondri]
MSLSLALTVLAAPLAAPAADAGGPADAHDATNLPILLAGGGFDHGRFVKHNADVPLSDLFVTLLNRAGLPAEQFGPSTGELTW